MRRTGLVVLSLLAPLACQRVTKAPAPATDGPAAAAAPGEAAPALQTVPVAGTVSMIIGQGGNIGVSVGDDGVLLIDDQFAPVAPAIQAEVARLSTAPIEFLINTHWHGDHTGGNPVFGEHATIVAHANVRDRLSRSFPHRGKQTTVMAPEGLPVVTFKESVSVHFNGEEIEVVHFPKGHTDGDSVVFFTKSNVVHMGDHLFTGKFPLVDLESGGNVASYTDNVGTVLAMVPDDVKIIPGHGALGGKQELAAFHHMLVETRRIVEDRLAKGQTSAAIVKAGLGAQWKSWGTGFISEQTWIETIIASKNAP